MSQLLMSGMPSGIGKKGNRIQRKRKKEEITTYVSSTPQATAKKVSHPFQCCNLLVNSWLQEVTCRLQEVTRRLQEVTRINSNQQNKVFSHLTDRLVVVDVPLGLVLLFKLCIRITPLLRIPEYSGSPIAHTFLSPELASKPTMGAYECSHPQCM